MSLDKNSVVPVESQIIEKKPYPGFLQGVWLLVLYLIVVVLFFIPIGIFGAIANTPLHKDPVLGAIVSLGVLTFVLWYGMEKTKVHYRQLLSFRAVRVSLLLPFVITIIGLWIVSSEINGLFIAVIPGGESAARYVLEFIREDTYAFIIFTIVIGPFVEEVMFRGLILRGFLQRYTARKAIVLSSLLFAVYHGSVFQIIPALFVGVLLAWWFIKTRSLVSCIFGHVVSNALVILVTAFVGAYFPQSEGLEYGPIWLDALGVILLVSGIWLSIRLFKIHGASAD